MSEQLEPSSLSLVRRALAEDLGGYGDVTSRWTVPAGLIGTAEITARQDLVACGLALGAAVMREVDSSAVFAASVEEGAEVCSGTRVAIVGGPVRAILTGERTVLNLISHLSGIATQARRFAEAVEGTGAKVVDTRKTTPGLRLWEKRAVVCGGCHNHRFGLFDLVLIKDNHIIAAGGVREAVTRARSAGAPYLKIEVEVETESQLCEAISCGADIIMLDNQDIGSLQRLVRVARELEPKVVLEASGGVTLDSVRAIAQTGVDLISTSALTVGAPPVDLSLSLVMED